MGAVPPGAELRDADGQDSGPGVEGPATTVEVGSYRVDRTVLVAMLRRTLAEDTLHLHYQPIYDLTTGHLIHHEALARWTHPVLGEVSPSVFVPLAEQDGLAVPLGRWALFTATRQAATWSRETATAASVGVNLSAQHFTAGSVVADVMAALERAGLPPERLVIELTESAAITDLEGTVTQLRELRALGLRLALDDFGTGYSSLTLIRRLPVHTVKIDRSFVQDVDRDHADRALVGLVIEAAHTLGLRTCAEGVERPEQLLHLTAMGCDAAQGYLLGRPGSAGQRHPSSHRLLPVAAQDCSASEYAGLLPSVSQLVCVLTPDLLVSYVSASCLSLLGYRPDELLGRHVAEVLHPAHAAALTGTASSEGVRLTAMTDQVTRLRHRDGTYRWMRFEGRLVDGDRNGARTHLLCTAQDVTAAVQARRDLERSHRLLQTAFDLVPVGMTVVTLDGTLLHVNRVFAGYLGATPAQLLGQRVQDLTHPDDLVASNREFRALPDGNDAGYQLVKRVRHVDGHYVRVALSVALLRDRHGSAEMALGELRLCSDLPERPVGPDRQPALAAAAAPAAGPTVGPGGC